IRTRAYFSPCSFFEIPAYDIYIGEKICLYYCTFWEYCNCNCLNSSEVVTIEKGVKRKSDKRGNKREYFTHI
ncbi:hypothetical protein, partial [Bacillus sp. JJ722]|uniref:hypothetical protein n=1 Tax=Bacillus sp. JJ722 TaxID=3122973 RepID=UPI002FFDCC47